MEYQYAAGSCGTMTYVTIMAAIWLASAVAVIDFSAGDLPHLKHARVAFDSPILKRKWRQLTEH
jgi:hypothetical protein